MNTERLKKKVIQEFTKSPAKTIVLISLCPVALYFIVPLLWPGSSNIDESQKAKVIATNLDATPRAPVVRSPVPNLDAEPTWQELNQWIDADRRRQPETVAVDQRDPFRAVPANVETDVASATQEPSKENAAGPELTHEEFAAIGLRLTGVLVGRQSRSATINGRRYVEGDTVTVEPPGQYPVAGRRRNFRLHRVGLRHAILEFGGSQFRLELRAADPRGDGIRVIRADQGSTP